MSKMSIFSRNNYRDKIDGKIVEHKWFHNGVRAYCIRYYRKIFIIKLHSLQIVRNLIRYNYSK